jgi:hypothetical protein
MPTNYGDELLQVLRARLITVPGLPAERRWLNTTAAPPAGGAFVDDGFTTFDHEWAECGPAAMRRCEATYRVSVRVPVNTDAHSAMSLAAAIEQQFATMQTTVGGYPLEVLSTRAGPALSEAAWLHVPVSVSVTFDHP